MHSIILKNTYLIRIYLTLIIPQVLDIYIEPMNERYYMLMMLIPLVTINLIRNLKLLAPFSQLANIITFIGLAIVLYYVFTDLPPVSSRPLVGEPRKYTLFVGTTLFALEAVGVVSCSVLSKNSLFLFITLIIITLSGGEELVNGKSWKASSEIYLLYIFMHFYVLKFQSKHHKV